MDNLTNVLPDRKTSLHLFGRDNKTWYGILIKVDSKCKQNIQKKLTKILISDGYKPSENNGRWVFAKGAYSSETLKKIDNYLSNCEGIIGNPILPQGNYFHFLGSDWLKKYKQRY